MLVDDVIDSIKGTLLLARSRDTPLLSVLLLQPRRPMPTNTYSALCRWVPIEDVEMHKVGDF